MRKKPTPLQQAEITCDWARRLVAIGFKEFVPLAGSCLCVYTNYVYPDSRASDRVELTDRGWQHGVHCGWYLYAHYGNGGSFQATMESPLDVLERAARYPHCAILYEKLSTTVV